VDALKYEFGLYDENKKDPLAYENQLPVMKKMLENHPENTRVLKFLADPPTTTLQRLKGMTTGSLPTFIGNRLIFQTNVSKLKILIASRHGIKFRDP
jgi:phosphatidylinositol glycan class O